MDENITQKDVSLNFYKTSFEEMAQMGIELLSKQPPVTLEEAKAQAEWLRKNSTRLKKTAQKTKQVV